MYRPGLAGGTRVTATYAERLIKRGHSVNLRFLGAPPPRKRDRIAQLAPFAPSPRIDAPEISPFILSSNAPYEQINGVNALDDRHFPDADVVVATFWPTAFWVRDLSPAKGAKAYFVQHGVLPESDDEAMAQSYRLPLAKITISSFLREYLKSQDARRPIPIVYNSVDTDLFHAPARDKNARFTVGFLYHHAPSKGVRECLDVWRRVKSAIPDARLVAFGKTPPTDDLPLPNDTAYTLRPPQNEIRTIYAKCDAWLCASRAEGFHLPPLEAMACRAPVVSTRVGGPADIIRDGENGFLADVGDTARLAERLIQTARLSSADWRALSDAAHATATNYTWDDATRLFEDALYDIAAPECAAARRGA